MSSAPETVRTLFDALSAGPSGREQVLALFADGAAYHMNAWQQPHVGYAAISAELDRQAALFADLRSELVHVGGDDRHAFVERLDHMTIGGKPVTLHFAGAFDFDDAGKIVAWRDYFDMSEVGAKTAQP